MGKYRDDARALTALVEPDRVHRDVYCDPEVFQLEMERLWARTWIYVGHASQVPKAGDYFTADIAAQLTAGTGAARILSTRGSVIAEPRTSASTG